MIYYFGIFAFLAGLGVGTSFHAHQNGWYFLSSVFGALSVLCSLAAIYAVIVS